MPIVRPTILVSLLGTQPINLSAINLPLAFQLTLSLIVGTLTGVIFTYIYLKSRSLIVASLFHGWYDTFRDSITIVFGIMLISSLLPIVIISLYGIYLLLRVDWKKLKI